MICAQRHDTVQEGDLLLLHGGYKFLTTCYVKKGDVLINKFGTFKHDDMIGTEFGRLVSNTRGTTKLVALRPTPELWSISLKHRTQIVFSMDASVISYRLNLRPGSVVVETGTGSGSLSHHFVRAIQPTGHLHTFEFNEHRATLAREEFDRHGIGSFVTVKHADAYADGFGLNHEANAVFLDLPMPWKAIENAKAALVPNGVICSFSPCVEQVQRTCAALKKAGFYDICTIESLCRPFYVKDLTSDSAKGTKPIKSVKEDTNAVSTDSVDSSSVSKEVAPSSASEEPPKKVTKRDGAQKESAQPSQDTTGTQRQPETVRPSRPDMQFRHDGQRAVVTRPVAAIRGHTSFLTFAILSNAAVVQQRTTTATSNAS